VRSGRLALTPHLRVKKICTEVPVTIKEKIYRGILTHFGSR
jgi:hypothetical protein